MCTPQCPDTQYLVGHLRLPCSTLNPHSQWGHPQHRDIPYTAGSAVVTPCHPSTTYPLSLTSSPLQRPMSDLHHAVTPQYPHIQPLPTHGIFKIPCTLLGELLSPHCTVITTPPRAPKIHTASWGVPRCDCVCAAGVSPCKQPPGFCTLVAGGAGGTSGWVSTVQCCRCDGGHRARPAGLATVNRGGAGLPRAPRVQAGECPRPWGAGVHRRTGEHRHT